MLFGARAQVVPSPKVYAYDVVKSNGNLTLQLSSVPSYHGGNEAEILIIAILGGNKFFCHLKGKDILLKDCVTFVGENI